MSTLKVENITKRFGDKIVLDNISFKVEEGEIFGFIGPNGAGKTTLINIMTTILLPDSGTIRINGYDILKNPIEVKKQIGYVPQEVSLLEEISAYANMEFFGALYGLRGSLLKERINEALEITGLSDKKKEKVKKFSGGMKRRLNLAVAIMHHPKVLILDEPTVGVDPQSRNHIFNFIKRIGQEWGTTVIYTSHYMEEIEELCERVFIIDLGQEIAYGNKSEVKTATFPNDKILIECNEFRCEDIINLNRIDGVINLVEKNSNEIYLTINEKFKLGRALVLLENHNIVIKKISYEEPKLEDVFLALTGKTLRD